MTGKKTHIHTERETHIDAIVRFQRRVVGGVGGDDVSLCTVGYVPSHYIHSTRNYTACNAIIITSNECE